MWPFSRKPDAEREQRDVQYSPNLSVMLAGQSQQAMASAGLRVTPETAMRMTAVYASMRVIAEDIASLPFPVFRRLPRGKERATKYPLYSLLHDLPNPEMTSYQLRETMTLHALGQGNAFAEIIMGDNGYPAQLWPIPPSRVMARRRTADGALEYYVTPEAGKSARIPAERMLHLVDASLNGVWGISRIALARESIALGQAAEAFASGFFGNGANPSVVYTHPLALSKEAHKNLLAELEATSAGLTNAQRIQLLEEGMDVKQLTVSPADAQFVEQRKFSIEEIARLFRVQPFKIGHHERSTFNNVEHLSIDHVVSTIRPWAVRWEQAVMKDLIPAEDRGEFFAEFVTAGLLRGDHAARGEYYRTLWNIGALSQNDIRELENMNPIDGGDTYYVPLNVMPSGSSPTEQAQRMRMLLLLGTNGHETRTEEPTWSRS